MQLLTCSKGREDHNYAQYQDAIVPKHWPGGGGFSYLIFTLNGLFEEHQKLHNWWTRSNRYYDLVRYCGVKCRFYRQQWVDYVVQYDLCYPMVDGKYSHASCHPQRLLMKKNKIIVGSKHNNPKKKPFITKFIHPPTQMINKWFFTKDLANTGLLLLSVASTSLNSMFIGTNSQSTTVEFAVLNPKIFKNNNWGAGAGNNYRPNDQFYYYGTKNGSTTKPQKRDLINLQGTHRTDGTPPPTTGGEKGNILFHNYLWGQQQVWVSGTPITDTTGQANVNILSQDLIQYCRYNPNKDTGLNNIAYIIQNDRTKYEDEPENNLVKIEGFPLWLLLFGWTDWLEKIKPGAQISLNYTMVIKSSFITPQLPYYVLLDESFINNKGPWDTDPAPSDDKNWYPKLRYQQQSINIICTSGPSMPRPQQKSWEAKMEYSFLFKWGGCLAPQQDVEDPQEKPTYTVPDKVLFRSEIEDPETDPKTQIHDFDFRRDLITEKAIKRIQEYSDFTTTLFTDGEPPRKRLRPSMDPEPAISTQTDLLQQTLQEAQIPQEDQASDKEILHLLKLKQQQLRNRILLLNQLKQRQYKLSI